MTKLTDAQEAELAELTRMRENYTRDVEYWEADLKRRKSELKEPMREQIAKLVELGVPMRQIHQKGLGMAQVNQMTAFLSQYAPSERLREAIGSGNIRDDIDSVAPTPVAREAKIITVDADRNKYEYVDENGESYTFAINPYAGWIEQTSKNWSPEIEAAVYEMRTDWAHLLTHPNTNI